MDKGEKLKNISIVTTLKYFILCTMIIVQSSCQVTKKNAWCDPYDTFCMFSEGNEVRVSSLSEAQLKCSEIKNDSWPVELGDERVKEVFIEFINNHSISNVILNAFNRNGNWYWKTSNITVQNVMNYSVHDSNLFLPYNSGKQPASKHSLVCITDCRAEWIQVNQRSNRTDEPKINGLSKCKEICEDDQKCLSVVWKRKYNPNGWSCQKLNSSDYAPGSSEEEFYHHVIDRTVKSLDRCITKGNGSLPQELSTPEKVWIAFGTLALLALALLIPLVIWKLKKQKKTDDEKMGLNLKTFKTSSDGTDTAILKNGK